MEKSSTPPPLMDAPTTAKHGRERGADDFREKGDAKCHSVDRKEAPAAAKKAADQSKASEDINESADAFIKKFRQQLLIQRLESIENYEQMLARGL
ncbi:uncharacterized protein LOC132186114 [Corylus avellana]|uniref:uncharacterized protein LOC132186114 n=1 Tax=Corylus avellana TaxID=13451 RepID=UPI00286CC0F9|nr:uncharacterized protein LOC132186114 [Corylus avellana]